jgi:hypothetical protein
MQVHLKRPLLVAALARRSIGAGASATVSFQWERQVHEFCQVPPFGPTMVRSPAHCPGAT